MQREAELRERERASIFFETWIKPFINQEYLLDFFTYEINKFHIPFFFSLLNSISVNWKGESRAPILMNRVKVTLAIFTVLQIVLFMCFWLH